MPSKGIHKTILDDIACRIKYLEIAVHKLQTKKIRTIPIYDKDHLPRDLPNGLIYFTHDSHQFGLVIDNNIFYATTVVIPRT